MNLSIIITTINEEENLKVLVPQLKKLFFDSNVEIEICIVDGGSTDNTVSEAHRLGCRVILQSGPGYAQAIRDGFQMAKGDYVIVMDGDLSHWAEDAFQLYQSRHLGDFVINSRYIDGGGTETHWSRDWLSRMLNWLYRNALQLPFREISGGFRIYRSEIIKKVKITSQCYEVQEEILLGAYCLGYKGVEIPYTYHSRRAGVSKAKILNYGVRLLIAIYRLRKIKSAYQFEEAGMNCHSSAGI